ncbi:putative vivid protein [Hypoxylon sp. FL1284]|nr:putative vivid protein [Hypoxylon sp. FL1284]
MTIMNLWEESALQYHYQNDAVFSTVTMSSKEAVHDSIIYPGLYAPSGFDMMNILIQVMTRPSPVIDLGPVDASCALIMCDLQQPDYPIVYASDAFSELTGYPPSEVLGRNCRFLQAPPGTKVRQGTARKHIEKDTLKQMRRAVEKHAEVSLEVVNYKRSGQKFVNLLTMIPVCWDGSAPRYCVGFQAEKTW